MPDPIDHSVWTDTLASGPADQPVRRLRGRKAVVAIGLFTAGLAAGSVGIAAAAGSSPSPSATTPNAAAPTPGATTPPDVDGPGKFGHGGGMRGMFGLRGALHGEFTVAKDGGGYQTMVVQRGKATAVSAAAITIKSDDGFTATYTVDATSLVNAARDGLSTVKVGHDVDVVAVKAGGNNTVVMLGDATTRQAAGDRWGMHRGFGPGTPKGSSTVPAQPSDFRILTS